MARRTPNHQRRMRWLRVFSSLSLLIALPGAGKAVGESKEARPCADITVSPVFTQDHVAICAHLTTDGGSATGVVLFATSDGGASWERQDATGLTVNPQEFSTYPRVAFSPLYEQDHTIFVSFDTSGLFKSTDLGQTFTLVDPFGGYHSTPLAMTIKDPLGGEHKRVMFAQAISGSTDGANRSVLIDTVTRLRTPITGTPGRDLRFLIPPGYENHGKAFAVGEFGLGASRHFEIFACNALFTCAERRGVFPEGVEWLDRVWFAGDFGSENEGIVFVGGLERLRRHLWWSRDGGQTFKPWTWGERLMARIGRPYPGHDEARTNDYGIAPVAGTGTVYLRTYYSALDEDRFPKVVLFRSKDRGKTWKRVSYGRPKDHPLNQGSLPIMMPAHYKYFSETNPGGFIVAPSTKKLFMAGPDVSKSWGSYEKSLMVKCSTDGGRTWEALCR